MVYISYSYLLLFLHANICSDEVIIQSLVLL